MKNSVKASKPLLIIVIAYCSVVLLIASFLLSSAAKYRTKLSAQTDTHIAQFDGALLESLALEEGGTAYVQTPLGSGSDLVLWDLYPGMQAREYAFVVSNGTDTDTHATVDLEFSVMLRTMENVPLKYTLVCGDKTYPAQYSAYPTAIADDHEKTSDTDWHEYTFYESEGSAKEAYFRLTSTDLSIQSFKLRVEWPVTADGTIPSNDASYMNEVEIVNVLIKLSSSVYLDVPVTPVVDDDDVTAVGLIVLAPDLVGGIPAAAETDVSLDVSYSAFRLVDDKYRCDFEITNGNRLYQSGVNVASYTDYAVQVQVPVTYYTQSMTDLSLIYRDDAGVEHLLTPTATNYYKYDILPSSAGYGNFVAVSATNVPKYVAATDTDLQYRIYKVFSYDIPSADARLYNCASQTDVSFAAYDADVLTLVCDNDAYTQALVAGDGMDAVYRRLCILVHAAFITGE